MWTGTIRENQTNQSVTISAEQLEVIQKKAIEYSLLRDLESHRGIFPGHKIALQNKNRPDEVRVVSVEKWTEFIQYRNGEKESDIILEADSETYFLSLNIENILTVEDLKQKMNFWASIYEQAKLNYMEKLRDHLENAILHLTLDEMLPISLELVNEIEADPQSTFGERTAKDFLKNLYYYYKDKPGALQGAQYDQVIKSVLSHIVSCQTID